MCKVTSPLSSLAIHWLVVVLAFLVVSRCSFGQSAKDAAARAQATALFAKALAVSDIRAPGSPPLEMRGTITAEQPHGKPTITGTYLLKWISPEKWGEEIHFAKYTRIRVGGKNQYWQSRSNSDGLRPDLQLSQALEYRKVLRVWSNPTAIAALRNVKLHQRKVHGVKLECATLTPKELPWDSDFCFDSAKGTLVSDTPGPTEFSDFISFSGRYFPGSLRVGPDPAVTLHVDSIGPLGGVGNGDFQPAEGFTPWPSCDDPDALPKPTRQIPPVYPHDEKAAYKQGTVFAYAIIGVDGRLNNLNVLSAPDSGPADAALTAWQQWEYTPEACHGTSVPAETLLYIRFEMGS